MAKNNNPKPISKSSGKAKVTPKPKAHSPDVKRNNDGSTEKRGDQGKFGTNRPPTRDKS